MKQKVFSTKQLSKTTVFNIDNTKHFFQATNQYMRMIFKDNVVLFCSVIVCTVNPNKFSLSEHKRLISQTLKILQTLIINLVKMLIIIVITV